MRIALVANSFPALSETFIYNHAAGLRAAGLDVSVVVTRETTDAAMFAEVEGRRYDGPIIDAILTGNTARTAARLASHLARHLARASTRDLAVWSEARRRYGMSRRALRACLLALPLARFEIVHLEYSGLAVAWLDALPLLDPARIVVSCRGAAEQIKPLIERDRADQLRQVFAIADRVHCVSDDMRETCVAFGLDPAKAFVNRPAIDVARFRRSSPRVTRTAGPYRLLSTGRLHWEKGIEFALMAVRLLRNAGHDVHYEIIGGGADEEHLRFSAKDLGVAAHVTFSGRRSSNDVKAALETADVYLLPSLSEGLSNAALEAMAMELPVVATTAGGMGEAIRDTVDGLVVPPRDAAAIAERVALLLGDPRRRTELGTAARRRVEEAFSLERQIAIYVAEYHQLRNEQPAPDLRSGAAGR